MKVCGTRETPVPPAGARVPGVLAALLEGHGALVHRPGRAAQHEHAVPCQQRHRGVAHLLHRTPGAAGVVDRTLVLVDQREGAATQRRALVQDRRHLRNVGPDGAEERVVVHRPCHVVAHLVQLEVERDAERDRPVTFDHAAVEVDAQHLGGPQLAPRQEPRVAQQRAVAQVDGDVAGQVVVVALAPQRAGQDDQLLARREVRHELVRRRREHGWSSSRAGQQGNRSSGQRPTSQRGSTWSGRGWR